MIFSKKFKNTIKICIFNVLFVTNYTQPLAANADVKGIFGLYVTPGGSFSNPSVESSNSSTPISVSSHGGSMAWIGGINYNHVLSVDKYYYSTGFSIGTEIFSIKEDALNNEDLSINETHNVKYIYISPIGFTLNTDEVGILDLTVFASAAGFAKIKIDNSCKTENGCKKLIDKLNIFGIDLNFRGGLKYALGPNTSLSLGVDWYIGMIPIGAAYHPSSKSNISGKTNRFGAYIGLWF